MIPKTTNSSEIFVWVEKDPLLVPNKFSLLQNYPNTFNPSTKIRFDLRISSNTVLTIYDVLGREVTTFVNENLRPGSYEVKLDASNYPSGVYLHKLTTYGFSETKKMILIK
jgi:hypothetical protein